MAFQPKAAEAMTWAGNAIDGTVMLAPRVVGTVGNAVLNLRDAANNAWTRGTNTVKETTANLSRILSDRRMDYEAMEKLKGTEGFMEKRGNRFGNLWKGIKNTGKRGVNAINTLAVKPIRSGAQILAMTAALTVGNPLHTLKDVATTAAGVVHDAADSVIAIGKHDEVYGFTDIQPDETKKPDEKKKDDPAPKIPDEMPDLLPYSGKTRSGEKISALAPNQVFVFGANDQGVHGDGNALAAKNLFGAIDGKTNGYHGAGSAGGTSWGIVTTDVDVTGKNKPHSAASIDAQIKELYAEAEKHPDREYLIGYTDKGGKEGDVDRRPSTEMPGGYSPRSLAAMFQAAGKGDQCIIPSNVIFHDAFAKLFPM